jgi:hypothetical protein
MKLTESRLRQIIREEFDSSQVVLRVHPENGLELVPPGEERFDNGLPLSDFDAQGLRGFFEMYGGRTRGRATGFLINIKNELGESASSFYVTDADQFVDVATDYIQMMQGRMADQQMTEGKKKFFVVWQQHAPTKDEPARFVDQKKSFSTSDAAQAEMNRLRAEGGKNRNMKLTYEQ